MAGGEHDCGILLCGSGTGTCIAANKVRSAHAANCSDSFSTERSCKSNNADILTLALQMLGVELAKSLVPIRMESELATGSCSEPKIQ